jgi:hypothetical protein
MKEGGNRTFLTRVVAKRIGVRRRFLRVRDFAVRITPLMTSLAEAAGR